MPLNYPKQQKKKKKPAPPRKTIRPADVPHRKTMSKPRPVRFEDGQIDKNITFLNPETKPKRNGPIKGSEAAKRCVMGGRPARSIEDQLDAASEAFMLKVIKGESFEYLGPTGKKVSGPAPVATRASVASTWLKKRRPDLTAQAIQAHILTEDAPEETHTDRELARMIGAMLYDSELEIERPEVKAIPDYTYTPSLAEMPSVEARVLEETPAPERKTPPDPDNPKHGDQHLIGWNNAHIRYYEGPSGTQGRWHVHSNINRHHSTRMTFDSAIKHAQSLPVEDGMHLPDPFDDQRLRNMAVANLDQRKEARPLGPSRHIRNIQERPKAWQPRRGYK